MKINERSNVEGPYLQVTKTGNKNRKNKYTNMIIGDILSSAEYRMDVQLQNLPIF